MTSAVCVILKKGPLMIPKTLLRQIRLRNSQ